MLRPGRIITAVPRTPNTVNNTAPAIGPRATPRVPPVTYTDIAVFFCPSGITALALSAPNG